MTNSLHRAQRALVGTLAALLVVPLASAQSTDAATLRRLQEENAALRKQLAALGVRPDVPPEVSVAPAATPNARTTSGPASMRAGAVPSDAEVMVLSPFEVRSDKDIGYLKTNSSTATRIGTEIQKVPLSISVISEDFIKDTGMRDLQDVIRYQGTSAGDGRMGIIQPATSFTPAGNISMRGFPINSRLRNGLSRYNAFNIDNVDRIELIKGPAAVFFGSAFPGGVINYVTKQPSFSPIPSSFSYSYTAYDNRMGGERATIDDNTILSDRAAMRLVGAWDNGIGDKRFEYQKGYSANAGVTLIPLKNRKLRVFLEGEVLQRFRNQDDDSWRWPSKWFADYRTPPANLIAISGVANAAAYQARIFNNIGQWIADVRNAANDPYIPLWTQPLEHGAYYTDRAGNRVHDEKFNYYGAGTYTKDENAVFSVVTDLAATDWLDARYSYSNIQHRFDRVFSAANPYADGVRFNLSGAGTQGYEIDNQTHQLDLVFKKKVMDIDNKFLVGGLKDKTFNSFYGSNVQANLFPMYGFLPGAYDKPDEGYVSPIPAAFRHNVIGWGVAAQFIRDRNGRIITPQQIFSEYDPAVHIAPDIRRITEVSRGLVDHSRPKKEHWYANWQGTMFQNRLTAFLGYRHEKQSAPGQLVSANPPWFTVPEFALQNIPESQWVTYGLSAIFSRPRTTKGHSKMAGASFEVVKNVNLYGSYSQTFIPSGVQYLGGDTDPNAIRTRATLLGLNPNTEYDRVVRDGFLTEIQNEKGKNLEFGVKVSLNDQKLVGSVAVYRVTRQNRNVDDIQRQADEPLNYLQPNRGGPQNRVLRWFTASATQENEGLEFEGIWSPIRNYQAVFSGGWMWGSKTVSDPSLTILPTSPAATVITRSIVFGNRLAYAPEYRLNVFNRYTFTNNFAGEYGRGLTLGLGGRYSSEIIISNDQNFNAARGGLTAGNYVVWQGLISYPIEVFGYKLSTTLNVDNVLDKEYSEGNFSLAPPRSYMLTLGVRF